MTVTYVLIGPPGSGKSSVGKALAKKLHGTLRDTDAAIEEVAGKKISQIFIDDGEDTFRALEKKIVAETLQSNFTVVSLGGGAILDEDSQRAIRTATHVIFLDVSIAQAAPRVGFAKDRPLLAINPRQKWLELMAKRRPVYESLATLTLSTDNKKPDEVAQEIISLYPQSSTEESVRHG